RDLMGICEEALSSPVEIELAVTFRPKADRPMRLSFLQVRPLAVPETAITVEPAEVEDPSALVATRCALGNGEDASIRDVVWMDPAEHDPARHPAVALRAEEINRRFLEDDKPYLLIGFGRWGSSDPWLGPPVTWGQICAARAIVEASLPTLPGDLSQGSHFFHNISSFGVPYFLVRHDTGDRVDWDWIRGLPSHDLGDGLRHTELPAPVTVKVDGRSGRGVIRRPEARA
ncbi:MAG TPA: phosphoenolpyruvate synthase, partial [bacterium]|nr:phosphoenolpyruvate synthase [bacterium]